MMSSIRRAALHSLFRPVLGIGLLALLAVGCQSRGDVSGKVTYKNKPLVFGTVLFEGSDGNIRQGDIDKDGNYTVRGLATGTAKVSVNSPNPRSITLISKNPNKKPEPYPDAPGWFPIPKKYEATATSGKSYEIKGGANTINIELD
jgi:hypothetical protein